MYSFNILVNEVYIMHFHETLKSNRLQYNIDIEVMCKKAGINFQTLKQIELGNFSFVKAKDLLSYLRVSGFKLSSGKPRLK